MCFSRIVTQRRRMSTNRDLRMRSYYGIRYDLRDNLFDWDYQMKLKDKVHWSGGVCYLLEQWNVVTTSFLYRHRSSILKSFRAGARRALHSRFETRITVIRIGVWPQSME